MKYKESFLYQLIAAYAHKFMTWVNPRKEMERVYIATLGEKPNLDNPRNLYEKIYWLLLNSDTSLWTKCADKYRIREYVRSKGLEEYMPKLLGKWDKAEDIDFNKLPNQFVMKTNNGCETVAIIRDKKSADEESIRKMFRKWLKIPYGYSGAQLHYTRIKPCIIAEELLKQSEEQERISPKSLIDYKVWCIEGNVECVWVAYNRDKSHVDQDLYDKDWNQIREHLVDTHHYSINKGVPSIPKPACLDEMFEIARKLSEPFHELRLDFYVINNRPVIGEMTFTAGYGFFTMDFYDYLGSKIKLPIE